MSQEPMAKRSRLYPEEIERGQLCRSRQSGQRYREICHAVAIGVDLNLRPDHPRLGIVGAARKRRCSHVGKSSNQHPLKYEHVALCRATF